MKKFNLNNEIIEIIDIIGNEATDWKGIVLALAKKDPQTLYNIVKGDEEVEFELHIYKKYINGEKNKGMCVKLISEKYGFGLKEAVYYFNDVIEDYESEIYQIYKNYGGEISSCVEFVRIKYAFGLGESLKIVNNIIEKYGRK